MENLTGKTALITGGSRGIGFGIAAELLKAGMSVAITSRQESAAQEAAQRLQSLNAGQVLGIAADVRNLDAQVKSVARVLQAWGRLDLVVANAGIGHFGSVESLSPEQWRETIDINLTGVFYTVKASLEALKASQGYCITIASLAGTNFFAGGSAYNASKFGLVGFTQAVMLDLRQYGIRVSTIMPGSVSSHFNQRTPGMDDDWKIQPEDIGQLIADLMRLHPRTLPSKIEVRPTRPPKG